MRLSDELLKQQNTSREQIIRNYAAWNNGEKPEWWNSWEAKNYPKASLDLLDEITQLSQRVKELEAGQGDPVGYFCNPFGSVFEKVSKDCKLDYDVFPLYTSAPRIPEGWQLVPKEPTEEMVLAARDSHEGDAYLPSSLYVAMLAAAPKPEDV